jgi:hypothetical protein
MIYLGITEIVDRFLAVGEGVQCESEAAETQNVNSQNGYNETILGFDDDFIMDCIRREEEDQKRVLSELNNFAKDHIIDKFFIIDDLQDQPLRKDSSSHCREAKPAQRRESLKKDSSVCFSKEYVDSLESEQFWKGAENPQDASIKTQLLPTGQNPVCSELVNEEMPFDVQKKVSSTIVNHISKEIHTLIINQEPLILDETVSKESEDLTANCIALSDKLQGFIPFMSTEEESANKCNVIIEHVEDLVAEDRDVLIEDVLDASCWDDLLRDFNEHNDSDDDSENIEKDETSSKYVSKKAKVKEQRQKKDENIMKKTISEENIAADLIEEIGIELNLASEEQLIIKFSQEIPSKLNLKDDAITSFYLSHCSNEEDNKKFARSGSTSEDSSYIEDDVISTFVKIENNAQLIQDWEKKQSFKKSCFVTISEDLHIVENITDGMAKSPEIDVDLDLVEVGKGESMTALDMFINTELADVQEIKQGLSILSKALTSPGLVRYHIYIIYLSSMFLKISVLGHSSLDLMLSFFQKFFGTIQ